MKAVLQSEFGGSETLYIGETAIPIITENEVLIKVHYSALNRADILQRQGKYPPPTGESTILGLEASGVITSIGESVNNLTIGDRVMALLAGGGQAEYVAVDQRLVIKVPDEISLEQAAAIPEVFLTAYQALFWEARTANESTVLIHAGASGVGTAAIQLANARGCTVITTSSQGKLATCKQLGSTLAINYQEHEFSEAVNLFTKGVGVNTVIDFIGAPYFKQNIECLSIDGTLIMVSVMGGVKLPDVNLYPILAKRLSIKGTTLRSRSIVYKQELIQSFSNDFLSDIKSGKIAPLIDSTYNWHEIKEAHNYMEANKNKGKIVLKII